MRLLFALLVLTACAFAQQQPPMADEDVVAIFNRISQRAAKLEPMLDQLHPNDWVAKGAPDTYVAQWNSLKQQYAAIQSELSDLSQHLDRMTESMKALFRIQAANQALESLLGGVRRYQNPALAELIESVAAESARDIDGFEQHLTEMSDAKEQQYALVDREAQRCRATLSREPAKPPLTPRKSQ
jgi:septal ring factor EnvC (AmiA/AmiB activator)